MTAPDSLDHIRHEMIDCAQEIATAGADSELPMAARLQTWAARIEALSPSKAEREFMGTALRCGQHINYVTRKFGSLAVKDATWRKLSGDFLAAYRALLAERGE